ncbi:MAG: hypothetical protein LBG24_08265 [Treponema sp.]|nr:hypothetical protein [Treponema sp.]
MAGPIGGGFSPDGQDSITETTLESPEGAPSGIAVAVEDATITFKTGDKAASFLMLETTQILTNRTEEVEIVVTLAQKGGL